MRILYIYMYIYNIQKFLDKIPVMNPLEFLLCDVFGTRIGRGRDGDFSPTSWISHMESCFCVLPSGSLAMEAMAHRFLDASPSLLNCGV